MQAVRERRNPPASAMEMRARVSMIDSAPSGSAAMWALALASEIDRILKKGES